MQYLQLYC